MLQKGNESIVNIITQCPSADVNIADFNNRTPLHHACAYGYVEVVKHLLNRKALLNIKSTEGQAPLHIAGYRMEWYHQVLTSLFSFYGAHRNNQDFYTCRS